MEDLKVCRCTNGNSFLELNEEKISEEHGSESRSVMSDSLPLHGLYRPWNSLGQTTGVGSHSLLQGIFPTQGQNPGLPHTRQVLYQLSHKESHQKSTVLEKVRWYGIQMKHREGLAFERKQGDKDKLGQDILVVG